MKPPRQPLGQRRGAGQRTLGFLTEAERSPQGQSDDPGGHRVREVHVADRDGAESRIGKKRQFGGIPIDGPPVADHRVGGGFAGGVSGLQRAPVEAEPEPGGLGIPGVVRELDAPHLGERVPVKHSGKIAAGHEGDEPAQVANRGDHRTRRGHSEREVRRGELAAVVAPHRRLGQALRRRGGHREGTRFESQRGEHLLGDRVREWLPGGVLQYASHHCDPRVRVLLPKARGKNERHAVQALDGRGERGGGVVEVVTHRGFAHESRAMRHESAQSDAALLRYISGCEPGQQLRHLGVEIQLAGRLAGHHRNVGEELGNRPHPEEGVGIGRDAGLRLAESPRPDDPVAVYEGERERRDSFVLHFGDDELGNPGRQILVTGLRSDSGGPRRFGSSAAGEQRQRHRGGAAGSEAARHRISPRPFPFPWALPPPVHNGSSSVSGAGPPSSRPGGRPPSASSKKSATRFQRIPGSG